MRLTLLLISCVLLTACEPPQDVTPTLRADSMGDYRVSLTQMINAEPEEARVPLQRAINEILYEPESGDCAPAAVMAHIGTLNSDPEAYIKIIRARLSGLNAAQITRQADKLDCAKSLNDSLPQDMIED